MKLRYALLFLLVVSGNLSGQAVPRVQRIDFPAASDRTGYFSIQPSYPLYNSTYDPQWNVVFNTKTDGSATDVADFQARLALEGDYNSGTHRYIEYNFDTLNPGATHNRRWMYLKVIRDDAATPMTGDWAFWGNTFSLQGYLSSANDTPSEYFSVSYTDSTSTIVQEKSIPARSAKLILDTTDSSGNPGSYSTIVLRRAGTDKWSATNQGGNGDTFSFRDASAEVYNIVPGGNWTFKSGLRIPVVTKSSSYTLTTSDQVVRVDATAATRTITLPAATGSGQVYRVKKVDSSGNAVSVARAGSDTIDGATSVSLATQYASVTLIDSASGVWDKY